MSSKIKTSRNLVDNNSQKQQTTTTDINTFLSQDAFEGIFLYLTVEELLESAITVCKAWYKFIEESDQLWDFLYHRDVPSFLRAVVLFSVLRVQDQRPVEVEHLRRKVGDEENDDEVPLISQGKEDNPQQTPARVEAVTRTAKQILRRELLSRVKKDLQLMIMQPSHNPLQSNLNEVTSLEMTLSVGKTKIPLSPKLGSTLYPGKFDPPSVESDGSTTTATDDDEDETSALLSTNKGRKEEVEVSRHRKFLQQQKSPRNEEAAPDYIVDPKAKGKARVVSTDEWLPSNFAGIDYSSLMDEINGHRLYGLLHQIISFKDLYMLLLSHCLLVKEKYDSKLDRERNLGVIFNPKYRSSLGSQTGTLLSELERLLVRPDVLRTTSFPNTIMQRRFADPEGNTSSSSRPRGFTKKKKMSKAAKKELKIKLEKETVEEKRLRLEAEAQEAARAASVAAEVKRIKRFQPGYMMASQLYNRYRNGFAFVSLASVTLSHGIASLLEGLTSGYLLLIFNAEDAIVRLVTKSDGASMEERRKRYLSWWAKLGPRWASYMAWAEENRALVLHKNFMKTVDPTTTDTTTQGMRRVISPLGLSPDQLATANHLYSTLPWRWTIREIQTMLTNSGPRFISPGVQLPILLSAIRAFVYHDGYLRAKLYCPWWLRAAEAIAETGHSLVSFTLIAKLAPVVVKAYAGVLPKPFKYMMYFYSFVILFAATQEWRIRKRRLLSISQKLFFWIRFMSGSGAAALFSKVPVRWLIGTGALTLFRLASKTSGIDLSDTWNNLNEDKLGDKSTLFAFYAGSVGFSFIRGLCKSGAPSKYQYSYCDLPRVSRADREGSSSSTAADFLSLRPRASRVQSMLKAGALAGVEEFLLNMLALQVMIKDGTFQAGLVAKLLGSIGLMTVNELLVHIRAYWRRSKI